MNPWKRKEIIGNATLYLGDCLEILPTLPKVDAVITDPPYGIGADKKMAHSSIRDNPLWANYGWDKERPQEECFKKLLLAASVCAIWGGNYFADLLPASGAWLVWRKPQAETGFSLSDCELCWTNASIAPRLSTFARRDGNVHPTQKPIAVMSWTIDAVDAGEVILDPFMGSGTTGVACHALGKQFIGIEIHEPYFDIACERIENAQRQERLFA